MLKLENIVAGYGHITALKDISLEVPQGSIVSLIGANGAGKTTTMKTIMGLVKPTSGRVIFEGQDITGRQTYQVYKHPFQGSHKHSYLVVFDALQELKRYHFLQLDKFDDL